MKFTDSFDGFVCAGDQITVIVDDTTYTARVVHDDSSHIDDDDTHNTDQSVFDRSDEEHATMLAARQAWYDNEWFYCGIVISAERDGWSKDYLAALWSIECNYPDSDNSYLTEIANELLDEARREVIGDAA